MKERDFWVLVVDDESDLALNLQDILRDRGYLVVVAHDGKTALDLCGDEGFDLGIIDMNLPDMQGDSLISSISESCPGMDFVIMTGHGTVESAARNVGRKNIIAYETKPLDIGRMMSFIDQVVQRRTLEKSLKDSEARFRNLFAHHSAIMLVLDPITGNIIDANNSAEQFYGWPIEQLKQMNIRQINTLPPTDIKSAIDDVLTSKQTHFEFKHRLADGSIRDVEAFSNKIETAGKTVLYSIIHDITQRKLAEDKLRELSLVDELTGLNNRRGFALLGDQQLKTADRFELGVALIYLDLDGMKSINDKYGHSEGDRALMDTANILRKSFRGSDIIARLGGDEFVGMAVETTKNSSRVILARLESNLAAHNAKMIRPYHLSISHGVAQYEPWKPYQLSISYGTARCEPGKPCSLDDLLERGDQLMYENKKGKGRD